MSQSDHDQLRPLRQHQDVNKTSLRRQDGGPGTQAPAIITIKGLLNAEITEMQSRIGHKTNI